MSEFAVAGDQPTASFDGPRTIIHSIYEFDPPVLEEFAQWLEQRGFRIPASQLIGPKQYVDVGYVETTSPINVTAGGTSTVLSMNVPLTIGAPVLVTANFPAFDFTATSGGDAQVILNAGATPYVMGRLTCDRQLMWPALLVRRASVVVGGTVAFRLDVQSLSGAITLQAGTSYGATSLLVQAK